MCGLSSLKPSGWQRRGSCGAVLLGGNRRGSAFPCLTDTSAEVRSPHGVRRSVGEGTAVEVPT